LSNEIEASYEILRKYQKYEKLRRYTEKNERRKRDINMSDNKNINVNQDKGLQGNEKIEQAIAGLQQEATQEMLAHTLTVIRRRMRENGQLILSVEPPTGDNQLRIGTVKTGDGKVWWAAFTSFEEELKGGGSIQSTFLTDIDQLFHSALQINEIEGIILNPWNRTIMLDKNLINIILGNV
jgi:hypothetical protein